MKLEVEPHPTIPNLYVTRDGRVFHEIPPSLSSGGYRTIRITNGNNKQSVRRHTVVTETYHGPRPPGAVVRHKDGNPGNDHADNLTWGSQAENTADTILHGKTTRGEKNSQAKLTEQQAREIKERRRAGESGRALADEFGISECAVCDLSKGRTWYWLP